MDDVEVIDAVPRHGGARPNSGPKKGGWKKTQEAVDYDKAKARHEGIKADLAEIELKAKTGEYVEREQVRTACATAFAEVAQALRMIPDVLERQLGLTPEQAERAEALINESLADLGKTLAMLGGDSGN